MRADLPIHGIAQDTKGFYKFRSAGTVLRSQRKLWGVGAFALCARFFWCSLPRLAADPSRSAGSMGGSAGGRKDLDGVGAGECGMFLAFLLEEGSG
jgi:hypothetical protein